MFSQSAKYRIEILQKYKAMIPDPLNRLFDNRVSKAEGILRKDERNKLTTQLFPAGNDTCFVRYSMKYSGLVKIYFQFCIFVLFSKWTRKYANTVAPAKVGPPAKKAPSCRKCHQPMKGHPWTNVLSQILLNDCYIYVLKVWLDGAACSGCSQRL